MGLKFFSTGHRETLSLIKEGRDFALYATMLTSSAALAQSPGVGVTLSIPLDRAAATQVSLHAGAATLTLSDPSGPHFALKNIGYSSRKLVPENTPLRPSTNPISSIQNSTFSCSVAQASVQYCQHYTVGTINYSFGTHGIDYNLK